MDGDLYFSVRSDPRFGSVSHLSDEEMLAVFAERGGDPDRAGKKDPLDCLLWQAERPDEPAWDTVAGPWPPRLARRVLPRSRCTTSARPSTCRAAAATWCSRTTR